MRRVALTLVVVANLVAVTSSAGPQQKPPTKPGQQGNAAPPRPAQPAPSAEYATEAFDFSVDRIPVGYKGHSLGDLYGDLATLETSKGEYETTAQYEARLTKLWKPQPGQYFAFIRKNITTFESRYDADTGELDVSLTEDFATFRDGETDINARAITFLNYSHTSSHVGTNPFGVSVNVTSLTGTRFALSVQNRYRGDVKIDHIRHVALTLAPQQAQD